MMVTTWIPRSSNIAEVDYDADQLTLTVTFQDGRAYEYVPVPPDVFDSFQRAASPGSFFYQNIRSRFAYTEV